MKLWIGMALMAIGLAGCQGQQKPEAQPTSPSVLDVNAPPTAYRPASYAPAPVGPAVPAASTDAGATVAPSSPAGSNYTVKKGDTLFRIAKEHYGDGKQWRRIAAANPGLTPTSLKAGQILVMP